MVEISCNDLKVKVLFDIQDSGRRHLEFRVRPQQVSWMIPSVRSKVTATFQNEQYLAGHQGSPGFVPKTQVFDRASGVFFL